MTRQRKWQLKKVMEGKCQICAKPSVTRGHCEFHRKDSVARYKQRYHTNSKFRESQLAYNRKWRQEHPGYMKAYMKTYVRKEQK